ncbi:hypothetical protein UFOVP1020_24 [uncultured Caudovirales phage]|uniref:Uncharacterized protein n=1 Tax=uncultured Caudovirales phage TaxID=2100421 RepID=A0A6J5MQ40_9CAUD|nr:hypothetical protein UFOVP512_29 [uncultured Caudovirales phage]CAB4178683.1 hypothetical protein UFOVP1020_24 [uncultured Caudovirales phage]CAB4187945.1 hypothetical protein UFOVP1170_19 [uncultured Caudovirales phage]CAB4220400.1 hypothetical protein UFOVP1621_26 [uncultured Caudovirales phage]
MGITYPGLTTPTPAGSASAPSLVIGPSGLGFYKGTVNTGSSGGSALTSLGIGVIGQTGDLNYGCGPWNFTSRGAMLWGATREYFGGGNPILVFSAHNGVSAGQMMGLGAVAQWNAGNAREPDVLTYGSNGTTIGSQAAVTNAKVLSLWQSVGDNGVSAHDSYDGVAGQWQFYVDGSVSGIYVPGGWSLQTTKIGGGTSTPIDARQDGQVIVGGLFRATGGSNRFDNANLPASSATTAASSSAGTATILYTSSTNLYPVGSVITVAGITPAGFNSADVVVTASSPGSVSYTNSTAGPQTVAGTIKPGTSYSVFENVAVPTSNGLQVTLHDYKGYDRGAASVTPVWMKAYLQNTVTSVPSGVWELWAKVYNGGTGVNTKMIQADGDNNVVNFGARIATTSSVTTGAPTTGTAGAWKMGIRVAATVILDTTQYVQLDIGGTLYKLAIAT